VQAADPGGSIDRAHAAHTAGTTIDMHDTSEKVSALTPTLERTSVHRVSWWKEVVIVAVFYAIYSWTRNQFGSNRLAAEGIPRAAFRNAELIIRSEQWMGLYVEPAIQQFFLPATWFIQFWNAFYGTAHFIVTIAVFSLLFWKRPNVFPFWRNTLAAMTAVAIIGFAFFPLMPPRLLDAPCPWEDEGAWGGRCIASELREGDDGFGYVDTLAVIGGPWSFDSDTVASISNQYAAMPSLHIGWSLWCAVALWPLLRRRWQRLTTLIYPLATLFCIVVTGNHYWLDGVGGLAAFGFGLLAAWSFQGVLDRLHGRRAAASAHRAVAAAAT
jgi:hypothetical protein